MRLGFYLLVQLIAISQIIAFDFAGEKYIDKVWRGYNENGLNQRGAQAMTFSSTEINYDQYNTDGLKLTSSLSYSVLNEGNLDYLLVESNDGETYKWLAIHSYEILILFDQDGYPFFFGSNAETPFALEFAGIFPGSDDAVNASSELIELIGGRETTYYANNLKVANIPNPWVEGSRESGIGEVIELKLGKYNRRYPIGRVLFISNGYVSYDRPDLFKANGRVKKIKIRQPRTDKTVILELDDSPNMQNVYLDKEMDGDLLEIEILDVFQGERYNDTCLNYLFFFNDSFDILMKMSELTQ